MMMEIYVMISLFKVTIDAVVVKLSIKRMANVPLLTPGSLEEYHRPNMKMIILNSKICTFVPKAFAMSTGPRICPWKETIVRRDENTPLSRSMEFAAVKYV
jgi:hypothetical protein